MTELEKLALQPRATIDPPRAIRVKTSTGWADLAIAGTPGYPSTAGKLADVLTVTTDGAAPTWQPPAPSGADLEYNGTYDPAKTYNDGDFVLDANGMSYVCVMDGTKGVAPSPWSSGQWGVPPAVNGQWLKGVGGSAVWAPITPADITGAVNGQVIKGVGGSAAWAPLTTSDVATQLPAATVAGSPNQSVPANQLTAMVGSVVNLSASASGSLAANANPAQVTLTRAGWWSFSVVLMWNNGSQDVPNCILYIAGPLFPGGAVARGALGTNFGRDGWTVNAYTGTAAAQAVTPNVYTGGAATLSSFQWTATYLGSQ